MRQHSMQELLLLAMNPSSHLLLVLAGGGLPASLTSGHLYWQWLYKGQGEGEWEDGGWGGEGGGGEGRGEGGRGVEGREVEGRGRRRRRGRRGERKIE